MSYQPISRILPQYEDYANWWLKAYEQGTTTPKVMGDDSTPSNTYAKLELDAQGFPNTSGGARLIPWIDDAFDLWIFPTEAEADANDTTNAIQISDNIGQPTDFQYPTNIPIYFATVSAMQAATYLKSGMVVRIGERANSLWDITTATANGYDILEATGSSLQAQLSSNNEVYSLAMFGVVGDGVADDTGAIDAAFDFGQDLISEKGKTYIYSRTTKKTVSTNFKMDLNGSTISFTGDCDGYCLVFSGEVEFSRGVFDFNDNYYCNVTGRELAPILFIGNRVKLTSCIFKDLLGIQDRFQYAVKIDHSTPSIVESCTFQNIRTATNTANTSGFCGGIFLGTDPDNLGTVSIAEHLISNCHFADIFTVANSSSQTFPDSDAIRTYHYEFDTPGTYTSAEDNIKASVLTVENCTFDNVLKSGTKVSNMQANIRDCSFFVDNANGQTSVFAAFRYQTGNFFTASNLRVSGTKIAYAVLAGGDSSFVDNIYFDSDLSTSIAVFCGGASTNNVVVDGVHIENSGVGFFLSAAEKIAISNVHCSTGSITDTILEYTTPSFVTVSNITTEGAVDANLLTAFNASSTCDKILIDGADINSSKSTGIIFEHTGITDLIIRNSKFSGTYNRVLVGGVGADYFEMTDCYIQTSTTGTTEIITANSISKVKLKNITVLDERTTKTGMIKLTSNDNLEIDGLDYTCTTLGSGVTNFISATGNGTSAGICRIKNSFLDSAETVTNTITATSYKLVSVINMGINLPNDLNGVITVSGNGGSVVTGFYGNIKTTSPVVGATIENISSKTS